MPTPNELLREFLAGETFFTLQEKYPEEPIESAVRAGLKSYCPLHPRYEGNKYPASDCPVCLDIYGRAIKKRLDVIRQARRAKKRVRRR
jgi:hypothetical protein